MESEQKRRELAKVYNSYRAAKSQYSIEDIPMPDSHEGIVLIRLRCSGLHVCVWSTSPTLILVPSLLYSIVMVTWLLACVAMHDTAALIWNIPWRLANHICAGHIFVLLLQYAGGLSDIPMPSASGYV